MNIDKNRVLILSPNFYPNIGGSEIYFWNIVNYFSKNHFLVYSYQYSDQVKEYINLPNIEVKRLNWLSGKFRMFLYSSNNVTIIFLNYILGLLPFSLINFLKDRKNIKVIHCNGLVSVFIAYIISFFLNEKIPIIVTILGLNTYIKKGSFSSILEKILLDKCEAIFCNTDTIKENIAKRHQTLTPKLGIAKNIYNPLFFKPLHKENINVDLFSKKLQYFYKNKYKIVTFVGRFSKEKQIHFILNVIRKYYSNYKGSKELNKTLFLFCGTGNMEKCISSLEKYGINVLIEHPKHEQLPHYYNISSILLWPSMDNRELSMVAIEGLACGLPIFASENSFEKQNGVTLKNSSSILPRNSILINPNDIDKLVDTLHDFIYLKHNKTESVEFAKKNYSLRNLDIYEKYYQ